MNKLDNMNIYEKLEIIKARAINRKLNSKFHRDKENYGNTRLPFGLCKENGIEIGEDWTPEDAWKALEGIGIYHDKVIDELNKNGETKEFGENSKTVVANNISEKIQKFMSGVSDEEMEEIVQSIADDMDEGEVYECYQSENKARIMKADGNLIIKSDGAWRLADSTGILILSMYGDIEKSSISKSKLSHKQLELARKRAVFGTAVCKKTPDLDDIRDNIDAVEQGMSIKIGTKSYVKVNQMEYVILDSQGDIIGENIKEGAKDYVIDEEEIIPIIWRTKSGYSITKISIDESTDYGDVRELRKKAMSMYGEIEKRESIRDKDREEAKEYFKKRNKKSHKTTAMEYMAQSFKVPYKVAKKLDSGMSKQETIDYVGGGDRTEGSCVSSALAYISCRNGYDVKDFRGGHSRDVFSLARKNNFFDEIEVEHLKGKSDGTKETEIDIVYDLLAEKLVDNKSEYLLIAGRHAGIVKISDDMTTLQYLELQSDGNNGFVDADEQKLKHRFGIGEYEYIPPVLINAEELANNEQFIHMMGYINTNDFDQQKGKGGSIK